MCANDRQFCFLLCKSLSDAYMKQRVGYWERTFQDLSSNISYAYISQEIELQWPSQLSITGIGEFCVYVWKMHITIGSQWQKMLFSHEMNSTTHTLSCHLRSICRSKEGQPLPDFSQITIFLFFNIAEWMMCLNRRFIWSKSEYLALN